MKTTDNPPAFPSIDTSTYVKVENPGMTLRDYFAGQALAGFLAYNGTCSGYDEIAHHAYTAADCMLAARQKEAS